MFPPRPKFRIPPAQLPKYEKQGKWVVQRKFNGTRTLIHVTQQGGVEAWRPGKTPHKAWSITPEIASQFTELAIEPGSEYWFDGELLYSKTTDEHYKNRVVLFDILQAGRYLFGSPDLMGRQKLLLEICGNPTELESKHGIALAVRPNIWVAETWPNGFVDRYQDFIELDEIEGLVLKRANSKLDNFGNSLYEVAWQIRCRKEHKNYAF